MRLELALLPVFTAIWLVALLVGLGLLPGSGTLSLDLYRLYGTAAVLGWLSGNVYVGRRRLLSATWRLRLLGVYLLGPPGLVYFLRALAPLAERFQAPLVPFYAFGVYAVFFLVPLSFGGGRRRARS